jgi:hypothetical protein
MIDWIRQNNRPTIFLLSAALLLLTLAALGACQVEDLVKVQVPESVAQAVDVETTIPLSAADHTWDDWVAWVDRQSRQFAESINRGNETAGVLQGLVETGISVGQGAAATIPGGAFLTTALGLLGGLFLKRPGDALRERKEKEASYNAGIEKGRALAEGVAAGIADLRDAQG